jgi:hypothetical protein
MPGVTDNFAIPYPCQGENINPAVFAAYAAGVENALEQVNEQAQMAQNRLRADLYTVDAGVAVAVNVSTQLLYTLSNYNNGMEVGPGPSFGGYGALTPDQAGLYVFTLELSPINTVTTLTSWKLEINSTNATNSATMTTSRTLVRSVATIEASRVNLSALGFLHVGSATVARFHWTGTGGPMNVYARFTAARIGPLP